MPLGALIGAGASLIGGAINARSQRKANEVNQHQLEQSYAQQKEFAQHGIRWRVEDAKRAGLHPLAALGAQTTSFSPIAIGSTPVTGLGDAISNMGQDLSRAYDQTRTRQERAEALERQRIALQRQDAIDALNVERHRADLKHLDLQNELLASQIARMRSAQLGPGFPGNAASSAVPPVGGHEFINAEIVSRRADQPSLEAGGPTPGFKEFRIGGKELGGVVELPNEPMSQALESIGGIMAPAYVIGHNVARGVERFLKGPGTAGLPELPKTHYWRWNPFKGVYTATERESSRTHNPWKRY